MKVRVQKRLFTGMNSNPWRSVMTWSPWKTVSKFDGAQADVEARQFIEACKRRGGLDQYRIMQGKTVLA